MSEGKFTPADEDLELPEFDVIKKAQHYNSHPSGVEAIDICRHLSGDWFNAFKYVFRADHKNGKQDIEKAIYYADDGCLHNIEMRLPSWGPRQNNLIRKVIAAETGWRQQFFAAIANCRPDYARTFLEQILKEYPQ